MNYFIKGKYRNKAMEAAAMENSLQFFKKLKIELPYDTEILLLGIYPKEMKAEGPCS